MLDLGCGSAECANPIKQRWPEAHITGIDRNGLVLPSVPSFVTAVQADVCALPFKPAVFGLIIIRHPDVFRRSIDWKAAINGSARLLSNTGCLLITCYSLPEAERINGWLRQAWLPLGHGAQIFLRPEIIAVSDLVNHDRSAFAWQKISTR